MVEGGLVGPLGLVGLGDLDELALLEDVHLVHHVALLAEQLLGVVHDAAHHGAHLRDHLLVDADEERRAAQRAHVDVLQHGAAQVARHRVEHGVAVRVDLVLVEGLAEVSLDRALHLLGHLVALQIDVDALQPCAVLLEPLVELEHERGAVGVDVDEDDRGEPDDDDREAKLPQLLVDVGVGLLDDVDVAGGRQRHERPVRGGEVRGEGRDVRRVVPLLAVRLEAPRHRRVVARALLAADEVEEAADPVPGQREYDEEADRARDLEG